MILKFSESNTELLCPSCGSIFLHHDKVEIFECREDERYGIHVVVSNGKATIDTSLEGNPSYRRHGLKIYFWCEECGAKPILSANQHKGSTLIDFDVNKT